MWRWARGSTSRVTHQLVMPQVAVWGPPIGGLKKAHVRLRREGTGGKFFRQYLEQSNSSSVAESFSRLVPLRTQRDERAGASEALAVCDLCSGSTAIRFLGSDYVTARSQSVASSSSRRGRELHCDHLPTSTAVHDFEQCTMATSANGASDALDMGPFAGYILFSSLCQFLVFMCYICLCYFLYAMDVYLCDTRACWYV
jgi:hypothetical protein